MLNLLEKFTFSYLERKIPSFGKFGPKNKNCLFDMKLGILANSNMQISMVMFTFSVLDRKKPFWGKFGPKKSKLSDWDKS